MGVFPQIYLVLLLTTTVYSEIGYFWHVTDFHWDHTYMGLDLSCNDVVEKYGIYGDYWCDAPWRLVNDSVEAMGKLKRDVDFILWTGDNTPHTSDDDVSFDIHDAMLGNITNLLKDVFPDVPVYATFGNHDYYPHNQFPNTGNLLYNRTFDKWKSWIGEESKETFLKGAYYTLKMASGLRIIGLNTNLYYTSNKAIGDPVTYPDPTDQFAWLEQTLLSARTNNEKVLLTAHIQPGVTPSSGITWMHDQYNKKMNELILNFADVITGMHFGHEHSDNFRVHYDSSGKPVAVQFCAPSVTPWRYKIPGVGTGPAHNPSIRLLKYNRTNGALLDYTQYYMDLPEVNRNNVSEWKIEYNATNVYGLANLSPSSVAELVTRMKNRQGNEFQSFHRFWTVSVDELYQRACDHDCHSRFYCNFKNVDHEQFQLCVKDLTTSEAAIFIRHTAIVPIWFFVILITTFI